MSKETERREEQLFPSFHGENCPGNGRDGRVECLCDACDYFLDCFPDWGEEGFFETMQATI